MKQCPKRVAITVASSSVALGTRSAMQCAAACDGRFVYLAMLVLHCMAQPAGTCQDVGELLVYARGRLWLLAQRQLSRPCAPFGHKSEGSHMRLQI